MLSNINLEEWKAEAEENVHTKVPSIFLIRTILYHTVTVFLLKLVVTDDCLLYFRYETSSGVLVISSGPLPHAIARLPLGKITLEVRVSDSLGASSIERFQVQVTYHRIT